MNAKEQKAAAKKFAEQWKDRGDEKSDTQTFWNSLLRDVYGVEKPEEFLSYEQPVKVDGHNFSIDARIAKNRVLIEQKSFGVSLKKRYKQSDGAMLSPFEQGRRYGHALATEEHPIWIIASDFQSFEIHNMNRPNDPYEIIKLENLPNEYKRLEFLVEEKKEIQVKEEKISRDAGALVGKLYAALLKEYEDSKNEQSLKDLNMLCVRLVFCLYAEDTYVFREKGIFCNYLSGFQPSQMRKALIDLFAILNQKEENRSRYTEPELAKFPYVNGGLFKEQDIEIPLFTDEIKKLLLDQASRGFDWSDISPTIFGAAFESTLNPETRSSGGMVYTSVKDIHKVIDPLFLDDLKNELEGILAISVIKTKEVKLEQFQKKLSEIVIFDPACGSGNFLTESYLSLRRLENETLKGIMECKKRVYGNQIMLGQGMNDLNPIQVQINQFYGIEINDFAVSVARTAMWIAEAQMREETEGIVHLEQDFLPLKSYTNIHEGNALRMDWGSIVPKDKLNYIIGNPPFVGARKNSDEAKRQKEDMRLVFGDYNGVGDLDYVSGWYKKAADLMQDTDIRAALVSTSSVTQGEQPPILWKMLFDQGIHIDFAHRSFKWNNDAKVKAQVHCVIIGFSASENKKDRVIYTDGRPSIAKNINAYLLDAENILVESRNSPLCDVPQISMGNQPIDGGYYLFKAEEMHEFINIEPESKKWFHPWYGAHEFINREPRYCLWLGECPPHELIKMPECLKRVDAVRELRSKSNRASTNKLAEKPTRFQTENMPKGRYIVIPEVSSEKRRYIPMGYMDDSVLCSNKLRLMPEATLYHFGVLESNVHMAWLRAICGRMKSDYDYSIEIVYNNFIWPTPTSKQRAKIEQTAKAILDARALYPESTYKDMYGDRMYLFQELQEAHKENDKAVMEAYGFWGKLNSEAECAKELLKMYQKLTKQ